jgi:DNA-3-methyladenine glycosylase I
MSPVAISRVVKGDDGRSRCPWCVSSPEYLRYHDEEWGHPVAEDDRVYEKLCLEGFQSGLSWLTILRKREGFRAAFSSFDPVAVARYGDSDVERLVSDASIVRNRAKILATIDNAKAVLALREQGFSLAGLVWRYEPARKRATRDGEGIPASTAESKALSSDLVKRGFRFVGPTTVYAAMQSLGVVNDHLARCDFRKICEEERALFDPPSEAFNPPPG